MLAGQALIADVDACTLPPGRMAFRWLGQQGLIVKAGRHVLYIDAFLTERPTRRVAPLLKPSEAARAHRPPTWPARCTRTWWCRRTSTYSPATWPP